MAYDTQELQVKLTGDSSSLEKSLGNTSMGFGKMTLAVAAGQAVFKTAELAVGLFKDGVEKLGGFMQDSITQFEESQNVVTQTNAVLKSTGGIAGVTADEVANLSDQFQNTTKYSHETTAAAENMLLTFTNIGKDVFPQTTQAVLDMSTAMGQDLQTTAIQVGKALQDPVIGVTALQRVGVRLTDSQKLLVKQMVATGDTMGAQKLILGELTREFGGSAEAAGTTFAGKLAILGNKFDDVKQQIGGALVGALTPFIDKIVAWASTDQAQKVIANIATTVGDLATKMGEWVTNVAVPWITQHWPQIQAAVQNAWNVVKGVADFLSSPFGVAVAIAVAAIMTIGPAFKAMSSLVGGGISMGGIAVAGAIADIGLVMQAVQTVQGAIQAMQGAANAAASAAANKQSAIAAVTAGFKAGRITQAQYAQSMKNLNSEKAYTPSAFDTFMTTGHFATGGIVQGNTAAGDNTMVATTPGEMILNGDQQSKLFNMINNGTASPNITVNVGMYAGMPVEKREIALSLYRELVRAARSQGVSLPMIGAVGVQ